MDCEAVLADLDRLIASRSILNHPFYAAWERGTLTRAQLAIYAASYYPHVAAFPDYLQRALEGAGEPAARQELTRNLRDEATRPSPHDALWLDFAEGLGCDRSSVAAEAPLAAAPTIGVFQRLTSAGSAPALAALYAYESQQPEVSRRKLEGLTTWYGVDAPKARAYFEVHATLDLEHRDGERDALRTCLRNGASPEQVISAAEEALDAYWRLLDAISVRAGICLN